MKPISYLKISALVSLMSLGGCDQLPSLADILAGGGAAAGSGSCTDPLFADQWHLKNTGQDGGTAGEDANVSGAWDSGITGAGVRIAVVDDGLEIGHEDLSPNVVAGGSWNYVYGTTDPTDDDGDSDGHGTAVGGVSAAKGGNDLGGCGVAYNASLVGYNFLDYGTDTNMVDAATRGLATDSVENNSWGYAGTQPILQTVTSLWNTAIDTGLQSGRGGKGIIYMFAAGNSNGINDTANYDNIDNYYGTFAIGAVKDDGVKSSYSERGANLLVSAPSGEYCDTNTTTTTDRMGSNGYNQGSTPYTGPITTVLDNPNPNYSDCFNGTSSATPVVTGVVALMLQANPNLTWRDVHLILARSARKNDVSDTGWITNGGGLHFNPKYGFGVVDASAAVSMAKTWTSIGGSSTQKTATASSSNTIAIPDNGCPTYQTDTINLSGSGISNIEYVDATVTISQSYDGDMSIKLISPSGTESVLSETRAGPGTVLASGFRFGSEKQMDESADGTWTLKVCDGAAADTGSLTSWSLKVYGR